MNAQDKSESIFGPYETYPRVYVSYSDSKPTLKRIIYEEEPEVPIQVQEPKKEDNNKMTWKQVFLYYLFLYTPSKEPEFKPQFQIKERKALNEEVLCESTTGFEIIQKPDGYYVHAKVSDKR